MKCALCNNKLSLILPFTATPPANELLDNYGKQEVFALDLMQCTVCNHIQIDKEIPKERLFCNYTYISNTGISNREYFKNKAKEITDQFNPKFVVDIGSNDGLFLSNFNCTVLGVDPAENITKMVPTIIGFFDYETSCIIKDANGTADVITCNNMFAHNKDLSDIIKGIKNLLSENGTFIFEVSYVLNMLKDNLFDLVYHEHFHHWHISPMINYFKQFGLDVYDAELIDTHGGSIRVFVKHNAEKTNLLKYIISSETAVLSKLVSNFKTTVIKNKLNNINKINELVSAGKTVSILGYPAKACTITYFYNLDNITDVFDDNELKIGKYSHKGLKIRSTKEIEKLQPDYLLILSWNYAEQLIAANPNFNGKFIILFPEYRMI